MDLCKARIHTAACYARRLRLDTRGGCWRERYRIAPLHAPGLCPHIAITVEAATLAWHGHVGTVPHGPGRTTRSIAPSPRTFTAGDGGASDDFMLLAAPSLLARVYSTR